MSQTGLSIIEATNFVFPKWVPPEESLNRIARVIERAKRNTIAVRCYISFVLGCLYEGVIYHHNKYFK